jgi:hypothetical protein
MMEHQREVDGQHRELEAGIRDWIPGQAHYCEQ